MARVLVPLANGCEELEAVTIIDLLRRAGIEVVVAGLADGPVTASRGVVLLPDCSLDAVIDDDFDMIALPGGIGTLCEISLALNLMVISPAPPKPFILIGTSWEKVFRQFFTVNHEMINDLDQARVQFARDPLEAVTYLQKSLS